MTPENKLILENLQRKYFKIRYPNLPERWYVFHDYSDKTANKLTRTIIDFIELIGGQAERINTQGQMRDKSKTYTDALGYQRTVGSKQWTKGTGTKGSADISAVYKGITFKIEIKIGNDKQSAEQKKYQKAIESSGGVYMIARDFDTWIDAFRDKCRERGVYRK